MLVESQWWGEELDYSHLDPAYLATAAGLICGEGSVTFAVQRGVSCTPRVAVILHRHDAACLQELHRNFGGNYFRQGTRPNDVWAMMGIGRVSSLVKTILPFARLLHSAKVRDMEIVLDYCQWRIGIGRCWGRGKKMSEAHRATQQDFVQLLKSVKVRG